MKKLILLSAFMLGIVSLSACFQKEEKQEEVKQEEAATLFSFGDMKNKMKSMGQNVIDAGNKAAKNVDQWGAKVQSKIVEKVGKAVEGTGEATALEKFIPKENKFDYYQGQEEGVDKRLLEESKKGGGLGTVSGLLEKRRQLEYKKIEAIENE